MGLFDIFDSGKGAQAAAGAYDALTQGYTKAYDQASGLLLGDNGGPGMSYYDKLLGLGAGALQSLDTGRARGVNAVREGYQDSRASLQRGAERAAPFYESLAGPANKGYAAYGDAFGLGGQEGYDRATASFHTSPGYEFQQQQGLDALNRTANSRGMLASGNNSQDILKFSQGLANNEWNNYTAGLRPYLDLAPRLADSQSNIQTSLATNMANLATGFGNNISNLESNASANRANMEFNRALALGKAFQQLSPLAYQTQVGIGQAGADRAMNEYAAEQAASGNMWGALLGVGKSALGFAGGL